MSISESLDVIENVDIELFIGEVKNYKEIWNIADENYHDRTKKRSAWINICRVFFSSFEEKEDKEKYEICEKLIKKWRNIKDNYSKSEKKRTKSGQGANIGRRYIYARQLSFLQTAGATTEGQNSLDEIEECDGIEAETSEEQLPDEADRPPRYDQGTSKKRKRDIESSLIDFLNAPVPVQTIQTPEQNPDMFFFQSILPSISNLTEDQKLEFRSEVLNIIKRLRAAPNILPNAQQNIQPYPSPAYPISGFPHYSPQPTFHQHSTHSTPTQNSSNYLHPSRSQQSFQRFAQPRSTSVLSLQSHDSGHHFNPISPCSTVASAEEDSVDMVQP